MREAKPLAGPAGAKPKGDIAPILTGVDARSHRHRQWSL